MQAVTLPGEMPAMVALVERVRVPVRRSIPHRARPLRSSAAPTAAVVAFPQGIAGAGATRRRRPHDAS